MGFFLVILSELYIVVPIHAAELKDIQQKETSVLQMVVLYTDKEGEIHPIQGGSGFLIGTESDGANYMITAREVTAVTEETEQHLIELYKHPKDREKPTYEVKAVVKRDVMIDLQLVAESSEMGFAIWKLNQPLYDRVPLILCDDTMTGVSGQKASVLGFPTAPDIDGSPIYYTMEDMISKDGILIGDAEEDDVKYIYHNILPNAGMVGGPILNVDGNVIAVNQSREARDGYYALQISELLPVLKALGIPYVTTGEIEAQRQAELAAVVHKEDLGETIEHVGELDRRHYYKKTYDALQISLSNAIQVNENEDATQEEVDLVLADLNAAMDALKEKPPVWVLISAIVAVVLLSVIIFVVIWKKTKPSREEKKRKRQEEFTVTQAAPEFSKITAQKQDYKELVKQVAQERYDTIQTGPQREEDIYGETTIFQENVEREEKGAYLIRKRTGEKIYLKGREFVIGKDPSQTDYCIKGNSAISRVHVVILDTGNGYEVSDKNATNGTYVNNVKVVAFQKASLKQGDILRLADEDFEFKNDI